MKGPFSAQYFLLNNKKRILTVLIMLTLTSVLYIGGSYLSNIEVEFMKTTEEFMDFTLISQSSGEKGKIEAQAMLTELKNTEGLHLIYTGANSYHWPTTLGFENGGTAFVFSRDDFVYVNERVGFVDDPRRVENNTLLVSEREAKFLNLKDGGMLEENSEQIMLYFGKKPCHVVVTKQSCFFAALISDDVYDTGNYMVTYETSEDIGVYETWQRSLPEKYPNLRIRTHGDRVKEVKDIFAVNQLIFISIIAMIMIVFFITVNAVLVGIYDTRKNEFILYQAIGISRKRIYMKVILELLLMLLIGLAGCLLLSFGVIFFLNQFVYASSGLQLYHFHPWSVISWLTCNIMIILPSCLLRIRAIKRKND